MPYGAAIFMRMAIVVSTPSKLEAEKVAKWMSYKIPEVSVDPADGEWGVFVPESKLSMARTAFREVVSRNPGSFFVFAKRPGQPYFIVSRARSDLRAAMSRADRAVREGAVKAVVLDSRGKVRFVVFDRRRVTGNPLSKTELNEILGQVRGWMPKLRRTPPVNSRRARHGNHIRSSLDVLLNPKPYGRKIKTDQLKIGDYFKVEGDPWFYKVIRFEKGLPYARMITSTPTGQEGILKVGREVTLLTPHEIAIAKQIEKKRAIYPF